MIVATIILGVAIGALSAIAPLGPVTLMSLRRALRGDHRGALAVGLGRIPPEVVYSGLATFGMAALLEQFPKVRMGFQFIGALILVVVGVLFVALDHTTERDSSAGSTRSGFGAGFLVSALNPTLIVSWSVIAGLAIGVSNTQPTLVQKLLFPLSIGTGIAAGYFVLVGMIARWGEDLEDRVIQILLKSIGGFLIAMGVWHAISMAGGMV